MSEDDFDAVNDGTHPDDEHDLEEGEEALEDALELDTQSQIFLEMRQQNLDLLRIAIEVAGYTGPTPAAQSRRREKRPPQHLGSVLRILFVDRPRRARGR